jgi:FKBP-type peptidyl-prolyl cis-trans isomerase FklB
MKIKLLTLLCTITTSAIFGQYTGNAAAGSGSSKLENAIDSVSFSLGLDFGNSIKQIGINELNVAAYVDGIVLVLNNDTATSKIKIADARPLIMAYIQKIQESRNEKNKKEGEDFLAKNKKVPGVKVTKSGVQYIILKQGHGQIPTDTSTVKVNYTGTLLNGTVFDSSIDKGQPLEIHVSRVIKGWQDVLKIMPVGSKWKIFIPQELGYSANVRPGGKIEPYMALIFEIELIGIKSDK